METTDLVFILFGNQNESCYKIQSSLGGQARVLEESSSLFNYENLCTLPSEDL